MISRSIASSAKCLCCPRRAAFVVCGKGFPASCKVDGYGFYPGFKFRVPLGGHGDCYDRIMMRVLELRESLTSLRQAMEQLPEGPIMNPKGKIRAFKPPVGEAYGRIEGPKGELGFYLISDGSGNPYRALPNESFRAPRGRGRVSRRCARLL